LRRILHGSLTVDNAPLDLVDWVTGNVTIVSTFELANTGTRYEDNQRIAYIPAPRDMTCQAIDGDLRAVFTRARVRLAEISGAIDVRNDFGSTKLTVARALAEKPHRIVSQSGRVAVHLERDVLGKLAVRALTNCGTVRTNFKRELLDEVHFSTANGPEAVHGDWRGFQSSSLQRFSPDMRRLAAVLAGTERTNGLDLVSRAGTLVLSIDP